MRTRALVQFRLPRAALGSALPESLRSLAAAAQDGSPGRSQAIVDLAPGQLQALVRWGREGVGERTRVRIIRLTHIYEPDELGPGPVELFSNPSLEPPEVLNRESAVEARWSCAHCDRLELRQIAPLEVTSAESDADAQITSSCDTLLTERFAGTARRLGAETLPVLGVKGLVQLVTPARIRIAPVFPLFPVVDRCPGCGRQSHDRSDEVEGNLFSDGETGFVVAQEWPLTVEPTAEAVGQATEPLGWRGRVSDEPLHRPGERLEPGQLASWTSGRRPVFLGFPLWRALLAEGARLPFGRPTKESVG